MMPLQQLLDTARRIDNRRAIEHSVLKALLKDHPIAFVAVDTRGVPVPISDRSLQEAHPGIYELGELPIERWEEVFGRVEKWDGTYAPPEEWPIYRALQGEEVRDEVLVTYHSGKKRVHLCDANPLTDEDGDQVGAVVYFWEVPDER